MKTYLVVISGKPQGPFSAEELGSMAITPGTFVKTADMDDYKEAHEIPELRQLLGFKAQAIAPQYFAPLDTRLLAIAIDYLLFFAFYLLYVLVGFLLVDNRYDKIIIALSGIITIPLGRTIYAGFMEAAPRQATLGKRLLGLKVCDEQGNPLSTSQSLFRNFCKWLSTLTLGIGYLMGFFDKKQQCLHDKLARTLVVKERLL